MDDNIFNNPKLQPLELAAMLAAKKGEAEILIQLLRTNLLNPQTCIDSEGNNPLHVLMKRDFEFGIEFAKRENMINILLESAETAGFSFFSPNNKGTTGYHLAIKSGNILSFARLTERTTRKDFLREDENGNTSVHLLAQKDDFCFYQINGEQDVLKRFQIGKDEFNTSNENGETPLMLSENPDFVAFAVEAGADSTITDHSGKDCVAHWVGKSSIKHKLPELQKALGKKSAISTNETAFTSAAGIQNINEFKKYIQERKRKNLSLDIQDQEGKTATQIAIEKRKYPNARELIKSGADPLLPYPDGASIASRLISRSTYKESHTEHTQRTGLLTTFQEQGGRLFDNGFSNAFKNIPSEGLRIGNLFTSIDFGNVLLFAEREGKINQLLEWFHDKNEIGFFKDRPNDETTSVLTGIIERGQISRENLSRIVDWGMRTSIKKQFEFRIYPEHIHKLCLLALEKGGEMNEAAPDYVETRRKIKEQYSSELVNIGGETYAEFESFYDAFTQESKLMGKIGLSKNTARRKEAGL